MLRAPSLTVGLSLLLLAAAPCVDAKADEKSILAQLEQSKAEYDTAEEWSERRKILRQEFLEGAGLWPLPARPPVEAIRHSLRKHDSYTVENVALETLPGFYCTGNLYRPVGSKQLEPVILCPHGHFQPLGRFREDHQIRCAQLARMGATVLSYSMVGWQDSQQTTHDDPQVLALQSWNSLRAVDFLTGLERVDPRRVGITGASGGGTQSIFLALIDERVKASAPLVIVYPWAAPEGCLCEGGLPVMQATRTNAIELAAATAPRPQLIISVGNDPTQEFPENGVPFIRHMYEVAGAKDSVANLHLADEGHDFGPTKRRAVYEFFADAFAMEPDPFYPGAAAKPKVPQEDLTRIAIETPEQMAVFGDAHPLPADALRGSDAIAAAMDRHLDELRSREAAVGSAVRVEDAPPAIYAPQDVGPADEMLLFTPPGFDAVGEPRFAAGAETGTLEIVIRDAATGEPTPCRVNVVGPDGHYYEPEQHALKPFSLSGIWPDSGWGNRQQKAPIRYLGRFFYTTGEASIRVPAGTVRVEVVKGFEYRPAALTTQIVAGGTQQVELTLDKSASVTAVGYWSGDPHIHIQRRNEADEQQILDLMEAEDIHFGTILAYNEPAGPYAGFMERMESPQYRELGEPSILTRGDYSILSGQEYRSGTYGHINFFLIDQLVEPGASFDANNWPPFGQVAHDVRDEGGVAFYAHGGYAQEIYADVVQGNVDGVELLQFGVYRGIGLLDWYHMLNAGFRVPANGACDYPACRFLGDCKTFVHSDEPLDMQNWLRGMADGRSFLTTGPMLLLEIDGERPGAQIDKSGEGPHRVTAHVRVRSEVAPVTNVQIVANGRVLEELTIPASEGQGNWVEFSVPVELERSAWIAARAYSLSPSGAANAESHTNPVYVVVDGKAPYDRDSLDALVAAIDGQIAGHKKRSFPELAQVIAYFERSRDILMAIRDAGGAPAQGHPSDVAGKLSSTIDPGKTIHSEEELKAFLQPVPPKSVEEALASFETVDGFEMQLVANEPQVVDPIAAAFDAEGNLYVCEMRDYPYKPQEGKEPIGTLRKLLDTDGNGQFDESHVFADKLLWAGGVAPWKDGVFVAAPPDIWYMQDTDGDHQADVKEKIYTGFGTGNQQAMLNNLSWGLDHKIYGSTAGNGGLVSTVGGQARGADAVSVTGHDFRFDPVTGVFEAITGTIQFGNSFDDWGNRFLCSESQPLLHAMLPEHYLARNPYLPVPSAIQNLTGGVVPCFRISPLERWRMIRSSRRVSTGSRSPEAAGASHHVIDAAAGVTIYRGGVYPESFNNNVFIGGAQNNLVHRRTLTPDGITFTSQRADENTEFVRSPDNWFRPVNFVNAPDGTLYVLDMSREVLESIHIPDDVVKYLDLTSGREHGRIYRIAPTGFTYPGSPSLRGASSEQLAASLEHPNGWWRETAHRLIYERQSRKAVAPLRKLLRASAKPQARLHALWLLAGLKALKDEDLETALDDPHASIREHAMALSESRLDHSPALLERVMSHADSDNPRLKIQAAFSLGESRDPRAAAALARLAMTSGSDTWLQTAVLSSAGEQPVRLFVTLLQQDGNADSLEQLASIVGSRGRTREVNDLLSALASHAGEEEVTLRLLLAIGRGLRAKGTALAITAEMAAEAADLLKNQFDRAGRVATDADADVAKRQQAVELLGCGTFEDSGDPLTSLLDLQQPEAIQVAAVKVLSGFAAPEVGSALLEGWRKQSPTVRQEVVEAMLARPQRTLQLLQAAQEGEVSVALIDATRRDLLLQHADPKIRSLANELFGAAASGNRAAVVAEYQSALELKRDPKRGEEVFRSTCMSCHKIGDAGIAIGPDLASSTSKDAAALLTHVLDPNRYLLPNYESYVVVDTDGRVYTGLIAAQTATSITLKREENKTDTILRTNIEELSSTGKSLMPEGLEQKITPQNMADLIAFLQASHAPGDTAALPVGTLPGLVEPGE